jgi:hypothetical protein
MPRLRTLLLSRARVEISAARRVYFLERLRARDIPAKEAYGGPSKDRRAERGALAHLGAHDLEPADVREDLHGKVPVRHPAVYLEVREVRVRVERHALYYPARLECVCLERRTRYMRWRRVRRQPDQQPRRVRVPVWREQPRERSHEVDPGRGWNRACERVDLARRLDHSHRVAQPFDGAAGNGDCERNVSVLFGEECNSHSYWLLPERRRVYLGDRLYTRPAI